MLICKREHSSAEAFLVGKKEMVTQLLLYRANILYLIAKERKHRKPP